MPGNQVKDWHIYHECMKGKRPSPANKTYCAKVANAAASNVHSKESIEILTKYAAEKAVEEALGDYRPS